MGYQLITVATTRDRPSTSLTNENKLNRRGDERNNRSIPVRNVHKSQTTYIHLAKSGHRLEQEGNELATRELFARNRMESNWRLHNFVASDRNAAFSPKNHAKAGMRHNRLCVTRRHFDKSLSQIRPAPIANKSFRYKRRFQTLRFCLKRCGAQPPKHAK